jgi:hypothetical protein
MSREKPKLLPLTNTEKTKTSTTTLSPDSIEGSAESSFSTAAAPAASSSFPPGSALQALLGKKMKPLPPANLEIIPEKNSIIEEKKKDSPGSNTDLDEDTSDIKTPAMSPHSPAAPMPTILELNIPSTSSKLLSSKYIDISVYQNRIFICRVSIE